MEIIALSDTAFLNHELALVIVNEISKHNRGIAYISATKQKQPRVWFNNTIEEYRRIGVKTNIKYFDLSSDYSSEELQNILQFGTLHLSGGNTFEFLNSLRKRNLQNILQLHVNKGGLIIGVSAGSIILTPSVVTASLNGDINTIQLADCKGLNFLPFEFYPHFNGSNEELDKLVKYSNSTSNIIFACSDTDGIMVGKNYIKPIGNVTKIQNGQVCTIN